MPPNPLALLEAPQLAARALEDFHRLSMRMDDVAAIGRDIKDLNRRMAGVERQLEQLAGFTAELTRTMTLLRKSTENLMLALPGSRMVARRAATRRRDLRGEQPED